MSDGNDGIAQQLLVSRVASPSKEPKRKKISFNSINFRETKNPDKRSHGSDMAFGGDAACCSKNLAIESSGA